MSQEIVDAVRVLGREKGISEEKLMLALEDALLSAYKHTPHPMPHARVEIDMETGGIVVWAQEHNADGGVVEEYDDGYYAAFREHEPDFDPWRDEVAMIREDFQRRDYQAGLRLIESYEALREAVLAAKRKPVAGGPSTSAGT